MESESLKKNLDEVTQRIEIVDADIESGRIEFEQIKTAYDKKDAAIKQTNARIEELTELNNRAQIDKNKRPTGEKNDRNRLSLISSICSFISNRLMISD